MSKALFQMWEPFRALLIRSHKFYVEQAKTRLLSQFQNIENESDEYAEEWLNQRSANFNPEIHSPDDFYEQATDEGVEYYQMLADMRKSTRLSVISGMYHEWDKQLRSWLTKEIEHWHSGNEVKKDIWNKNFSGLMDLLDSIGFQVKSLPSYASLEKCRFIVNVYKHGDGLSFNEIKMRYPEFINTFDNSMTTPWFIDRSDHTCLVVSDAHVDEFAKAIIDFWESVPPNIINDGTICFPKWFENALRKDFANSKKE
jgi:hypothetical protein